MRHDNYKVRVPPTIGCLLSTSLCRHRWLMPYAPSLNARYISLKTASQVTNILDQRAGADLEVPDSGGKYV